MSDQVPDRPDDAVAAESAAQEPAPATRRPARLKLGEPVAAGAGTRSGPSDDGAADLAAPETESAPTKPRAPGADGPERTASTREPARSPVASRGLERPRAEWREIQAQFVDDPRASVERALHAVETELVGVLGAVRQHPSRATAGSAEVTAPGAGPDDTERLRLALRSCRAFWADLVNLGGDPARSG